jgi:hypothetical protein
MFSGDFRHPLDMGKVARIPFLTMGNSNLLSKQANSTWSGRTAGSKLVVLAGPTSKHLDLLKKSPVFAEYGI